HEHGRLPLKIIESPRVPHEPALATVAVQDWHLVRDGRATGKGLSNCSGNVKLRHFGNKLLRKRPPNCLCGAVASELFTVWTEIRDCFVWAKNNYHARGSLDEHFKPHFAAFVLGEFLNLQRFRLVGVLNDRQFKVKEFGERVNELTELAGRVAERIRKDFRYAISKTRHRLAGIGSLETNFDVTQSDVPA